MHYLNRIKKLIPGVIQVVMFYSNGTVFHASSNQTINIPSIGESLAEIIEKYRHLMQLYDFEEESYKKILYETNKYIIAIIKLGEESHLALLFDNKEIQDVKIAPIKHYLTKLEELIDMDQSELNETPDNAIN